MIWNTSTQLCTKETATLKNTSKQYMHKKNCIESKIQVLDFDFFFFFFLLFYFLILVLFFVCFLFEMELEE